MEARLPVGVILHRAHIAIGLHKGILSLNHVTVALLLLVLVIARVGIIDGILEGIAWMGILWAKVNFSISAFPWKWPKDNLQSAPDASRAPP